uniref:Uncharacterized protein n=1 Tax=Setaria viridis TaxID=4556 RepID=A0A4U6ULL1_SETVI|nr:hypothetical protein SEVIR_5G347000v2 [Setaria viridis]
MHSTFPSRHRRPLRGARTTGSRLAREPPFPFPPWSPNRSGLLAAAVRRYCSIRGPHRTATAAWGRPGPRLLSHQQQMQITCTSASRGPGAKLTPGLGTLPVGTRGAGGANSRSIQRPIRGSGQSPAAFHTPYDTGNQRGPARQPAAAAERLWQRMMGPPCSGAFQITEASLTCSKSTVRHQIEHALDTIT